MDSEIKKGFRQAGAAVAPLALYVLVAINKNHPFLLTGFGQSVVAAIVIAMIVAYFKAYMRWTERKKKEIRDRREARKQARKSTEQATARAHVQPQEPRKVVATPTPVRSSAPRNLGGGARCPVCSVSSSDGRALVKHVSNNLSFGLEGEALRQLDSWSDSGVYFCPASFAISRLPSGVSTTTYLSEHFPRLSDIASCLHHAPVVDLNTKCFVCQKNNRPALFSEFIQIRDSGGSHTVGDPSVHCTMTDIRWVKMPYNAVSGYILSPVHTKCSSGLDLSPHHMGRTLR